MLGMETGQFVAHIRRLARDGALLYVRIGAADISRLQLRHGQHVEIDVGQKASIRGVVKTSAAVAWLAPPGRHTPNAAITATLRSAGFEHGDDVPAVLRVSESSEPPAINSSVSVPPNSSAAGTLRPRRNSADLGFDSETAIRAVQEYNAGAYRGCSNLDLDRMGYERFREGLPHDEVALVDILRFVGDDYGGAQRRFLPHGFQEEATLIVANLYPVLAQWEAVVAAAGPLVERIPDDATITKLLKPFVGTKRWPVWASKTLHFLRPDAFPIMDSRAQKALGLTSSCSYAAFCHEFRGALLRNCEAL